MSTLETIRLVARRELVSRVATRAFLISTLVTLALIVGGQVAIAVFTGDDDPPTVGLVGDAADLEERLAASKETVGLAVDVERVDTEKAARDKVEAEELDAALVRTDDGYTVVTESDLDPELRAAVEAATTGHEVDQALRAEDVDPSVLDRAAAQAMLTVDPLDPEDPDQGERRALAYVAVLLLFFTVYLYGIYVAMGVVEEKTSRVVELILATIKPVHLLVGKVIGIGAVGLLQVVLFGAVAVVAGMAVGTVTLGSTAVALLVSVLFWYLLGYTFFAMLYAGFGALVSRQEDVNSVTMPLSALALATFFVAQSALSDPGAGWVQVMSWIPPFSAMVMPMRVADGNVGALETVGSAAVMLLLTGIATVVAAWIYQRSVLNIGSKQSLRQLVAAGSSARR